MVELDPRDNPRPQHERDAMRNTWRHRYEDTRYWYLGLGIVVLFLIGLFAFGSWDGDNRSGTQVGQNTERPAANPETPRDPNSMGKKQ